MGSILLFSWKDCLGLIHTVLHAIPNPYHHHSYLPHTHLEEAHSHAGQVPHTHKPLPPATQPHDLMDHLSHDHSKDPVNPQGQGEIKTISELTWTCEPFFACLLYKPYRVQQGDAFYTVTPLQLRSDYPPTPPPQFS